MCRCTHFRQNGRPATSHVGVCNALKLENKRAREGKQLDQVTQQWVEMPDLSLAQQYVGQDEGWRTAWNWTDPKMMSFHHGKKYALCDSPSLFFFFPSRIVCVWGGGRGGARWWMNWTDSDSDSDEEYFTFKYKFNQIKKIDILWCSDTTNMVVDQTKF